nr:MAG TPA: hypothetical protein [Caudoviricetes sp.]
MTNQNEPLDPRFIQQIDRGNTVDYHFWKDASYSL